MIHSFHYGCQLLPFSLIYPLFPADQWTADRLLCNSNSLHTLVLVLFVNLEGSAQNNLFITSRPHYTWISTLNPILPLFSRWLTSTLLIDSMPTKLVNQSTECISHHNSWNPVVTLIFIIFVSLLRWTPVSKVRTHLWTRSMLLASVSVINTSTGLFWTARVRIAAAITAFTLAALKWVKVMFKERFHQPGWFIACSVLFRSFMCPMCAQDASKSVPAVVCHANEEMRL